MLARRATHNQEKLRKTLAFQGKNFPQGQKSICDINDLSKNVMLAEKWICMNNNIDEE